MLRQWAEDKYRLPWNHDVFQDQTILDLLISFWEDYYQKNSIEAKRTEDGEVVFETGDPYIDKWERELAAGITPDLLEGMGDRTKHLPKLVEKDIKAAKEAGIDPNIGFSDDYSRRLPR